MIAKALGWRILGLEIRMNRKPRHVEGGDMAGRCAGGGSSGLFGFTAHYGAVVLVIPALLPSV